MMELSSNLKRIRQFKTKNTLKPLSKTNHSGLPSQFRIINVLYRILSFFELRRFVILPIERDNFVSFWKYNIEAFNAICVGTLITCVESSDSNHFVWRYGEVCGIFALECSLNDNSICVEIQEVDTHDSRWCSEAQSNQRNHRNKEKDSEN
jgi:hypothetical protein